MGMQQQLRVVGRLGVDDGFADDSSLVNPMDCIGCEACSRGRPKACIPTNTGHRRPEMQNAESMAEKDCALQHCAAECTP